VAKKESHGCPDKKVISALVAKKIASDAQIKVISALVAKKTVYTSRYTNTNNKILLDLVLQYVFLNM
jgi:hypothetical protein